MGQKMILGRKKCWVQKNLGRLKQILVNKILGPRKLYLGLKNLSLVRSKQLNIWVRKNGHKEMLGSKTILGPESFWSKNILGPQKNSVQKAVWVKKNWVKKYWV